MAFDNTPEGQNLLSEQKGKTGTGSKSQSDTQPNEGNTSPEIRAQYGNDGLSMTPHPTDAAGNLGGNASIGSGDTATLGSWPVGGDKLFAVSYVKKSDDAYGPDHFNSDRIK